LEVGGGKAPGDDDKGTDRVTAEERAERRACRADCMTKFHECKGHGGEEEEADADADDAPREGPVDTAADAPPPAGDATPLKAGVVNNCRALKKSCREGCNPNNGNGEGKDGGNKSGEGNDGGNRSGERRRGGRGRGGREEGKE